MQRHRDVLPACVAAANDALLHATVKIVVTKTKQMHRAKATIVIICTNSQAVTRSVEGDVSESVILIECQIDILATHIAIADSALERSTGKIPVTKTEQIRSPRLEFHITKTCIKDSPNCQAVTCSIQ